MGYRGGNYLRLNKIKIETGAKNLRERSSVEDSSFIVSGESFPGCKLSQPPRKCQPLIPEPDFLSGFHCSVYHAAGICGQKYPIIPPKDVQHLTSDENIF